MSRFDFGDRRVFLIGLAFFIFGVCAGGARIIKQYHQPGPFSHATAGFCDFHNGLYFPTRALIDGVSPYGQSYVETYPVSRQLPFFSPAILVMHIPLAVLPIRPAEIIYFVLLVVLILAISTVCASIMKRAGRLDVIFAIAGALVMARGGHSTIYDGYFTFELILATVLSVHWADRKPWLAALALVVVSAKPTYILPLGFLLLARGNYRALVIGAVFSILAAVIPFGWLAYQTGEPDLLSGFLKISKEITASQDFHLTVLDETPLHTWTRIDLFAIVSKWLEINPSQTFHMVVMFPILIPPMIVLFARRKNGRDDGAAGVTGLIVLAAMMVSVYHHSYDALVLILPMAAISSCALVSWQSRSRSFRFIAVGMICVLFYNYVSTQMFLSRFPAGPFVFKVLTSISGVAAFVLLLMACYAGWNDVKGDGGKVSEEGRGRPNDERPSGDSLAVGAPVPAEG